MSLTVILAVLSTAFNFVSSRKTYVAAAVLVLLATYDIGTGQYRQAILQIVAALAASGIQASISKEAA